MDSTGIAKMDRHITPKRKTHVERPTENLTVVGYSNKSEAIHIDDYR